MTQGPAVANFENEVAGYCGAKYAVAVNSGTSALHAACFAAGISSGDEVITSPITFAASSNAVLYCGGKPVFADISSDTVNLDPDQFKEKITSKTKAVIPVHFSGHPCDMEKIHEVATEKGLAVIEDAAHALGAEYLGSKVGSCRYSDMTVLSFHAVKHITTGEGGMVLTNSEEYYEKLAMFRSHGITRDGLEDWHYEMHLLGFNYRITDFQCVLGSRQIKKLASYIERRREIVDRYQRAFSKEPSLLLPVEKNGCYSSWHLYCIRVKGDRKAIFRKLRGLGILVNVHYLPVYLQPYYLELGYRTGDKSIFN